MPLLQSTGYTLYWIGAVNQSIRQANVGLSGCSSFAVKEFWALWDNTYKCVFCYDCCHANIVKEFWIYYGLSSDVTVLYARCKESMRKIYEFWDGMHFPGSFVDACIVTVVVMVMSLKEFGIIQYLWRCMLITLSFTVILGWFSFSYL
jgi:hypothetical protein